MFEPQSDHSEAIKNIIDFLKIPDIIIVNRGVALDDIKKLKESDFILLFNVLQHAGEDYDREYVKNINDWENYAIRYLKALKQKSKYLIFQTGYTWIGHKDKLCENNEIMKYSLHLLIEAGWQVEKCGIIKSLLIPKYVTVDYKNYFAYLPLFSVKNRIIAKIQNKLKLSRFSYRFAQRPIFICKNLDGK